MLLHRLRAGAGICGILGLAITVGLLAASAELQPDKPQKESVAVRYSRASLKMAELELKEALAEDRKVAGSVPAIVVERLRMNVKVAESKVEEALHHSTEGRANVQLRYAEERARLADLDLEQSQKARAINPRAVSELELE